MKVCISLRKVYHSLIEESKKTVVRRRLTKSVILIVLAFKSTVRDEKIFPSEGKQWKLPNHLLKIFF